MRAVVQRVSACTVTVSGRQTGHIDAGLLVYLGVGKEDTSRDVRLLCDKIVNLRIFTDHQDKMNLSVRDTGGGLLVVSQFTLFGDAREGRRPSYSSAADPQKARELYQEVLDTLRQTGITVESGEFQAMMEVTYTNMGPVTILLDSEKRF
jgi:D-tyrosyl-tRNA(Tyr) deacylase